MVADSAFTALIYDSLMDPSPSESVFRVKNAVSKELEALDSTATILRTEYFNHTFAPDFVLRWRDSSERKVFLRSTYNLDTVAEDIRLIDSDNPLVFGLTPTSEAPTSLTSAIDDKRAMFTDPAAVEEVIDLKTDVPVARMLGNALAQGGRGLLTGQRPASFVRQVAHGFEGAREVRHDDTADAVEEITTTLEPPQAWRMTRVLQAVWEGSEGPLDSFPGTPDLSGKLNTESLQYLITYMDGGDREFWRRIGRKLTLQQLTELRPGEKQQEFENLIRANLDVIHAGAGVVLAEELNLDGLAEDVAFHFGHRGGFVSFSGARFSVLLGELKKDVEGKAQEPNDGISADDVIRRKPDLGLTDITFRVGAEGVTYTSDTAELDRDRLLGLAGQWRDQMVRAKTAVAKSFSGRIHVDFTTRLAWRQTNSHVLMADLLTTAIPLLHDLADGEGQALRDYLAFDRTEQVEGAVALFDGEDIEELA